MAKSNFKPQPKPSAQRKATNPKATGAKRAGKKAAVTLEEAEARAAAAEAAKAAAAAEAEAAAAAQAEADAAARADQQEVRKEFSKGITELLRGAKEEGKGLATANEARWRQGRDLTTLLRLGDRLKEAGDPDFQKRGATTRMIRQAWSDRAAGSTVKPLGDYDMASMPKAYQAYVERNENNQGLDTTFQNVGAWNREDDEPLTLDDGTFETIRLVDVALSKAYMLADSYSPTNHDAFLSFLYRHPEQTIRKVAALVKAGADCLETMEVVDEAWRNAPGEDANDAAIEATAVVAKDVGLDQGKTTKSIRVDAGLYDGMLSEVRRVASLVYGRFGGDLSLDDKGHIPWTVFLERVFKLLWPPEVGEAAVVDVLIAAGDITEEQGATFLSERGQASGDGASGDGEPAVTPPEPGSGDDDTDDDIDDDIDDDLDGLLDDDE